MQLQKSASAGRRGANKTKKPGSYFHTFLPITESRKEAKKTTKRNSEIAKGSTRKKEERKMSAFVKTKWKMANDKQRL